MDTKYLEIIKAPIVTEKSSKLAQEESKYVFKVDSKATKTEIKNAIEKIFKVKVEEISTMLSLRKEELDVMLVLAIELRRLLLN